MTTALATTMLVSYDAVSVEISAANDRQGQPQLRLTSVWYAVLFATKDPI